jgi:hypothetical protein
MYRGRRYQKRMSQRVLGQVSQTGTILCSTLCRTLPQQLLLVVFNQIVRESCHLSFSVKSKVEKLMLIRASQARSCRTGYLFDKFAGSPGE